ncbi:MAG: DUF1302 domain-containing protein [Steroidobacteraceae bacterium]|nr:DUF1302 domain-containing protein [Steroidobacteraceae bacterium]MCW5572253.1 DUF1302 domain-containing protein [Steroidobacteraceae bacterium]
MKTFSRTCGRWLRWTLPTGIAATIVALPAHGIDFQNEAGTLRGSWDTTLSYGQAWRIEDRDCRLIANANGGCGRSANGDDGDLNYPQGLFSRAAKIVTEFGLNYEDVGLFVRGAALYDFDVMGGNTARTRLSDSAKQLVGSYERLLDAFVYWKFGEGATQGELRLGRQVASWGESTFIQGGINVINHFDVAALRVPGSELREGFMPQEMALLSLQFNDYLSGQAVYIADWDATIPEPVGSYFSTNDIAVTGGNKVLLGFGAFSDQGVDFGAVGGPLIADFQQVPRLATRTPDEQGQYGVNLKLYLPNFNNGTEFGLYFLNYHSRLPVISGRTGTQAGIGNSIGGITAVGAAAQGLAAGLPLNAAIATAAQVAVQRAAAAGGDLSLATATQYATIGANTHLQGGNVTAQATNIGTHEYARTAGYFTEYPEDIKLIGLSFNTQLQRTGIALQGEFTYRMDQPLQLDDVELLFAALTPFEQAAFAATQPAGTPFPTTCLPGAGATLSRCGQFGAYGLNTEIRGWEPHDVGQFQFTATKSIANVLRASQLVLVAEFGVTHVFDMENKLTGGPNGRGLRYNGPATSVSGNGELAARHFGEVEPQSRFADATSWGYRLAGRLEYPGLVGPWNVLPRFAFQHDVEGVSPGPGGNFQEGRYGLTLGVGANLRATWEVDFAWTKFAGAGRWNELGDRDYMSATVKYSF